MISVFSVVRILRLVSFSRKSETPSPSDLKEIHIQTAVVILVYLAAWGVLHSLLATSSAKALARRLVGPASDRAYRLVYNLVAASTLTPVVALPALDPGMELYRIPWPWSAAAVGVQLFGAGIAGYGVLQTGAFHFLGLSQLAGNTESAGGLVTSGLYRWVRHPLYTGSLLFIWLIPVMTTSILALNLGLTAYIYIGSLFEERKLVAAFGDEYREYQRRVPRLIPRPRRAPD